MKGIHVYTVMPATIDTPHFEQAANYTGRKVVAMPPVYSPERVARAVVDLVRHPHREVVVGPAGRALVRQSRMAPGLAERARRPQGEPWHGGRPVVSGASSGLPSGASYDSRLYGVPLDAGLLVRPAAPEVL